ncbi:hypothetical protein BP5796_04195 [Coleophoma crateriformis]|uniref:OmpA-like domain-containing protein n=1 Tax=Coleophoma crateriformis TaxID=565419 RepID=A0A3D8SHS4_9HELO|nr:hypothetical protein BP5796_04195 [Coleophoma crateriformis]
MRAKPTRNRRVKIRVSPASFKQHLPPPVLNLEMPPKPFNPPRPKGAGVKKTTAKSTATKSKASTTATKRKAAATSKKSKSQRAPEPSDEEDVESNASASSKEDVSRGSETSRIEVDVQEGVVEVVEEEERATIPPELLTRLLHEFFQQDGTRIAKDANAAIGKYVEIFTRESLTRCVYMKREQAEEGGRLDDGFCEVEDLEKLAPQLLLDF